MTDICNAQALARSSVGILGVALLTFACVGQTHFRFALVIGESMCPAYHTGDLLLVDKSAYREEEPRRGDIVLARHGDEMIVKRVVGLPGEEVALRQGHLYVNGSPVSEHHPIQPGRLEISPGIMFAGKFALLGDNRALPIALLVHAVVSKEELVGKVVGSYRSKPLATCSNWLAGGPE
jgi:signal peptidase I